MNTCTNCGSDLANPAARFCGDCGTPVAPAPVAPTPAMPTPVAPTPVPPMPAPAAAAPAVPAVPQPVRPAPAPVLEHPTQQLPVPVAAAPLAPVPGMVPGTAAPQMRVGVLGGQRSTIGWIILMYFTLGIASLFWIAGAYGDMKRYTGKGLGSGAAILCLIPIVNLFFVFNTPARIGALYQDMGLARPCGWATAFWLLIPIAGPAIYLTKCNESLNAFWRSLAA